MGRGGRDFLQKVPSSPPQSPVPLPTSSFPSTLKSEIAMSETPTTRPAPKQRTYRKNQFLFALIGKMKLWPSRKGILHGIRTMEIAGDHAVITTHCGRTFTVRDSRTSRASRWLRNKIFADPCPICAIPEWKLKKYQGTVFRKKSGAILRTEGGGQ